MRAQQLTTRTPAFTGPRLRRSLRLPIPWHLFSHYILGKIVIPYFVLVMLLAVLTIYVITNLVVGSMEEQYREELTAAGRAANESMVLLEADQLTILRQMSFTVGMDEALLARDPEALRRLLAPIAANAGVPLVAGFAADGAHLLTLQATTPGAVGANVPPVSADWPPVRRVLAGDRDAFGDKFAALVRTPSGTLLVTAAPVPGEAGSAGVLVTALPLERVLEVLAREAGRKTLSVYSPEGALLASTMRGSAAGLATALALEQPPFTAVEDGGHAVVRHLIYDARPFVEVLGVLTVRREPQLLLGAGKLSTAIEDGAHQVRNLLMVLFSAMILLVLLIGALVARMLVPPVRALVDAAHRIRRNDLDLALPVTSNDETGVLTQAFNEMAGGLRERERARIAIERYLSPKLYQLIQRDELRVGGENRVITVLVSDIRDFTALAERMPPDMLLDLLNRYFEAMFDPISRHDGEVDKYLGDGILAKFGATEWYPDHARRAVLAAIDMLEACDWLNVQLQREGQPLIRMGIGVNSGAAVVGNIGAARRMEYTIVSDAVNTAERIGSLCKPIGWDLLISQDTYRQATTAIEVGEPWTVQLRGRSQDTLVYPVLGRAGQVSPTRRRRYYRIIASQTTARRQPAAAPAS